jgi:SnoaL-like domain
VTSSRGDIENALQRLFMGMDTRRIEIVGDCYTPDARLTMELPGSEPVTVVGRDAITARLESMWQTFPPAGTKHLLTNLVVERETDDEAEVYSYLTSIRIIDDVPTLAASGWHRDVVVREADRWRISRRHQVVDARRKH